MSVSKIIIFCIVAVLVTIEAKENQVPFVIATDTILHSDLIVSDTAQLTILPGVVITIDGYHTIRVEGMLLAIGKKTEPIVIAPARPFDSVTRDAKWRGIEFAGKRAQGIMRHCRIEGAFRHLIWESEIIIDSCTFIKNHYALYCAKNARPHIMNSHFRDNTYGLAIDNSLPIMSGNTIVNNTIGLYLQLSAAPVAGKNIITANGTDIKSEDAFGPNQGAASLQYLWDALQQLY